MFFTIEISRPVQWLPGFYRSKGITTFRVWWLFFSVSFHPMRYDEMIDLASSGVAKWDGRLTPNAQDGFAEGDTGEELVRVENAACDLC